METTRTLGCKCCDVDDRGGHLRCRALMLKELEELIAAEMATATGVPLQTLYSRVRAARSELDRFRAQLREGGSAA